MRIIAGGRIGIAAQTLSISAGIFEVELAYCQECQLFGKSIFENQAF